MVTIKTQLQIRQTQQLVMTPQLQQAIRLLQLSRLELAEMVQKEMLENPVLDEVAPSETMGEEVSIEQAPVVMEERPAATPDREDEVNVLSIPSDIKEWESYLDSGQSLPYASYEEQERPSMESMLTRPATLAEHLEWQLRMSSARADELVAGQLIIGNLDDRGYLAAPLEEVLAPLGPEGLALGEAVLARIQQFDPPGVAARTLSECLLIQLRLLGLEDGLAVTIVRGHLDDLGRGDYDRIARETGSTREEVVRAVEVVRELEPKPGRPFGGGEAVYVTPDVYVFMMGGEWTIHLNDDGLPKLRINSFYRELMSKGSQMSREERDYLLERVRSASWLIKSIDQRQRTIYKVAKSILNKQMAFFEKGVRFLKPMILRDVADDIGVHESTVSRITTHKYLNCPQGMFELKYFFNPGISTMSGEMLASESVRAKIRDIIRAEHASRPYSDQAIAQMLRLEGIEIARRTVAKYREAMGLLPSSQRRADGDGGRPGRRGDKG